MSAQTTEQMTGGFAGDPSKAFNSAAGGCCGGPAAGAGRASSGAGPCCGTTAEAQAEGSCCATAAKAEAVASGTGCCG